MSRPVFSVGAAQQAPVPAAVHNLPTQIAGADAIMSNLVSVQGYNRIALGFTATQPGTFAIQRYLDDSGLVPQGAALGGSFNANTPVSFNITDNLPFASFQVTMTNAGSDTSYITNLALLVSAQASNAPNAPLRVTDTALEAVCGTILDAPYAGSGAASNNAVLKGIWALLNGITSAGGRNVNVTVSTVLSQSDTNTTYTNVGAAGDLDLALPAATVGLRFALENAQNRVMRFLATSDAVIRNGADVGAANGSIAVSAQGQRVTLVCSIAGQWSVENSLGDLNLV